MVRLTEAERSPTFRLNGLSPEAHGTLMALQDLKAITVPDEPVARELTGRGYAEVVEDVLRLTVDGFTVRQFEEEPLNG